MPTSSKRTSQVSRTIGMILLAASSLPLLASCGPAEEQDTLAEAQEPLTAPCKKRLYVHLIAYGPTNYPSIYSGKNSCWGLETPKWTQGAAWDLCNWNGTVPTSGTKWAYDDVNVDARTHHDATVVAQCRARHSNITGTVYVAANSGASNNWSHGTVKGAAKWLHECYDSDAKVNNRLSGCATNGIPLWNIGASTNAYDDVMALCRSRQSGQWLGIYAATPGLRGKEPDVVKALNDCTTK